MIDYQALRALQLVIELQSFELASKALGISQPAVSQRIQSFESYVGSKLLVRMAPYTATKSGEEYLNLLRKVMSLEAEIIHNKQIRPIIKLAINRDSLDLYFLEALGNKDLASKITLQIIADDQDNTLNYLKSGQVDMCISSSEKSLPSHNSIFLGSMKYSLVCSKGFYKEFFKDGVNKTTLANAPLVVFDKYDKVQHKYLKDNFGIDSFTRINNLPSVSSFKKAVTSGFGYGLLPYMDIEKELKSQKLIQMNPSMDFNIPLYLHHWEYLQDHVKMLIKTILKASKHLEK
ncbi:transcriptional regulator, ArgP family [Bacteriovorax sp. BAL6_X]|uniref:ArgP/LysG family DNA-binding transcriptional regulator n=1 Tax=Bacteriovorax sp. BAL6_X TaxID=1201290 RepID=UPI0003855BF6|nr:ArgP/LysG family DNA-binding transcriptional regulator [Bacteriovorax sp. BAL6_X]EPZ49683.1 transcriptional regulator, ArgP family [Bacteriovorax sp. BAL6_X]